MSYKQTLLSFSGVKLLIASQNYKGSNSSRQARDLLVTVLADNSIYYASELSHQEADSKPHHSLQIDTLNDKKFPYQLTHTGYLVSFSHSTELVSLVVQLDGEPIIKGLGIDTEQREVRYQVAKRFFAANEMKFINSLNPLQQASVINKLWQAKEAWIKATQKTNLVKGLATDMTQFYSLNELLVASKTPQYLHNLPIKEKSLDNQENQCQFIMLSEHESVLCLYY